MSPSKYENLWSQITEQVISEWKVLPVDEKNWITEHAQQIAVLQTKLHQLFLDVDGASICRDCNGDCCGHGTFHLNLANLLVCLVKKQPFPEPHFAQNCPYLGSDGCQFPPGLRPYNCISFICEKIEESLSLSAQAQFYRLEKEVRHEYGLFTERYIGAGMNGILVRGEALPAYLVHRKSYDKINVVVE